MTAIPQNPLGSRAPLSPSLALVAVCLGICLLVVRAIVRRPRNLPPGPRGIPILGVLPLMGHKPYLTLQRWWRNYGDVYSAYMGSRLVVVINGVEAMKECFVKQGEIFTGRPPIFFQKATNNTGLVFTHGEVWREHKRFAVKCLREFGMGKLSMEQTINGELGIVLQKLDESGGTESVDIRYLCTKAVANILFATVYGSRFDFEEPALEEHVDALDQSVRRHSLAGLVNYIPSLQKLMKVLPSDPLLQKNIDMRDDFAHQCIQGHKETLDVDNPRNFTEAYLAQMKQLKDTNTSTTFEERHLKRTLQDLFIAGTKTSGITISWLFFFMALHPEVQTKIQAEIDHVIGKSRLPSMRDKASMPYTEAAIMECQRLGNVTMISVPRCTLQDTKVKGYNIPKGSWVLINRWGAHASSRYWKRPFVFDPTRFLSDGKVTIPEGFVPFGMGPRMCIGEVFAKMKLFLFLTGILQQFTLRLPKDVPVPSIEPVMGMNLSPQQYAVQATRR